MGKDLNKKKIERWYGTKGFDFKLDSVSIAQCSSITEAS